MSYAITPPSNPHALPTGSAVAAAAVPVLAYHTSSERPVGLHVERRPLHWVIELFPPRIVSEAKEAAVWATRVAPALILVGVLLIRREHWDSSEQLAAFALALVLGSWLTIFTGLFLASLAFRASVRIEVLPAVVCWTVTGFRLGYETVCPRAQIAAIEHRWHGIRFKRRDRRRGDWIAFGTRAQQRQICQLLGEALGMPVRRVGFPGPPF